jgi:rod shape determining protein RodA
MESWFDFDKRIFKHFSYLLMLQVIPLFVISSYLINEINPHLFTKQMVYYFIAAIVFFVSAFIPWRQIIWWFVPIFYVGNLGLLIAVEFVGKTILGAQRWIEIPGVGITIQPSEFIKVSVIMMLGYLIGRNPPEEKGYGILNFIKLSIVIVIPFYRVWYFICRRDKLEDMGYDHHYTWSYSTTTVWTVETLSKKACYGFYR